VGGGVITFIVCGLSCVGGGGGGITFIVCGLSAEQ